MNKMILAAVLVVAAGAVQARPLAMAQWRGHAVVLTDEVREDVCPVGQRLAVAVTAEGKAAAVGCYQVLQDGVVVHWQLSEAVPGGAFKAIEELGA